VCSICDCSLDLSESSTLSKSGGHPTVGEGWALGCTPVVMLGLQPATTKTLTAIACALNPNVFANENLFPELGRYRVLRRRAP